MKIIMFVTILLVSTFLNAEEILLSREGGVYHVPATLNGTLRLNFIVDTGASMVYLPRSVFEKLQANGTVTRSDIVGRGKSRIANGDVVDILIINLRKIKIGHKEVKNVQAGVGNEGSSLLLGQSLLKKLEPWHIDTERGMLIFASKRSAAKRYVSPSKNIGRSEALMFVNHYLSLQNGRSLSEMVSLYAEMVDYRDAGMIKREVVAKKTEHFFRKWQNIKTSLIQFMEARELKGKKGETVVRFKTFYRLENMFDRSRKSGQALTTLILKKEYGAIRIISEKVKVISENSY